jgi:hypothetical protein
MSINNSVWVYRLPPFREEIAATPCQLNSLRRTRRFTAPSACAGRTMPLWQVGTQTGNDTLLQGSVFFCAGRKQGKQRKQDMRSLSGVRVIRRPRGQPAYFFSFATSCLSYFRSHILINPPLAACDFGPRYLNYILPYLLRVKLKVRSLGVSPLSRYILHLASSDDGFLYKSRPATASQSAGL